MTNKNLNVMKCAHCAYTVPRFITVNGKAKSGLGKLRHHFETVHHDKYEELMAKLGDAPLGEQEEGRND